MLLRTFVLFAVAMSLTSAGWAQAPESDQATMEELLPEEQDEEEIVYQEGDVDEDFFDDLDMDLEEDFE